MPGANRSRGAAQSLHHPAHLCPSCRLDDVNFAARSSRCPTSRSACQPTSWGATMRSKRPRERSTSDYRATWWISEETEAGLRADLVALGIRLAWVGAGDNEEP